MQNFFLTNIRNFRLVAGVSAVAIAAATPTIGLSVAFLMESGSTAIAQEDGHGGGGKGGGHGGGSGGAGGKGGGHSDGGHTDDDHSDDDHTDDEHSDDEHSGGKKYGGSGSSQGGHGTVSGQTGQQPGKSGGSRPVWAKEGIPSNIELGRMNVARSPDRVLDKAAAEALAAIQSNPEMISFYSLTLDEMEVQLEKNFDGVPMIDSPVANLGLLKESLGGRSVFLDAGVNSTPEELSAVFLGTASDKNIPITPEVAYSVSKILGYELTEHQAEALADDAEEIREAILDGHG
jgi:hypothetical protein